MVSKREADRIIDACMAPNIQWAHYRADNWQFYVGEHVQRVWHTLNFNQKMAIALDATALARKRQTA